MSPPSSASRSGNTRVSPPPSEPSSPTAVVRVKPAAGKSLPPAFVAGLNSAMEKQRERLQGGKQGVVGAKEVGSGSSEEIEEAEEAEQAEEAEEEESSDPSTPSTPSSEPHELPDRLFASPLADVAFEKDDEGDEAEESEHEDGEDEGDSETVRAGGGEREGAAVAAAPGNSTRRATLRFSSSGHTVVTGLTIRTLGSKGRGQGPGSNSSVSSGTFGTFILQLFNH